MDIKHPREAALLDHYDSNLVYYSPSKQIMPALILHFKLDMDAVKTVLDIGCGDGRLSLWLAQKYGMACDGVDYSKTRIDKAIDDANALGLTCNFECADLNLYLDSHDRNYDMVTAFEVLEHLEDPRQVIADCRERLNDGGFIIGSVPENMPYVAHLQVFSDAQAVEDRLKPDKLIRVKGHFYCVWNKA